MTPASALGATQGVSAQFQAAALKKAQKVTRSSFPDYAGKISS